MRNIIFGCSARLRSIAWAWLLLGCPASDGDGAATEGASDSGSSELPTECLEAVKTWGPPVEVAVVGGDTSVFGFDEACVVSDVQTAGQLVTTMTCTTELGESRAVTVTLPLLPDDPGPAWAVDDAVTVHYVERSRCDIIFDPGTILEVRADDDALLIASHLEVSFCFDASLLAPVPIAIDDERCRPEPPRSANVPVVFSLGDATPLEIVQGQNGIVTMADGTRYAAAANVGESPFMDEGDGAPYYGLSLRRLP